MNIYTGAPLNAIIYILNIMKAMAMFFTLTTAIKIRLFVP